MRTLRMRRYAWWLARQCELAGTSGTVPTVLEQKGSPRFADLEDYLLWWLLLRGP